MTVALPVCPAAVALMVAVPWATPVTLPESSTVATEVAEEDQLDAHARDGLPLASRGVAVSWTELPTCNVSAEGWTLTLAIWTCWLRTPRR